MSGANTSDRCAELGTLMWIGDETVPEFQEAYDFCVSQVAQLALRRNIDDALCRPAGNVQCILFAQTRRRQLNQQLVDLLIESYPQASVLSLLGSLCEGAGQSLPPTLRRADQTGWHAWNQVLPRWLRMCGAVELPAQGGCQSVAVLASTMSAGQPLLDLAESAGVTAVWCQNPGAHRIRNVDAVWWDDSVAAPASSGTWRRRLASFQANGRQPRHAWIANAPRYHQHHEAKQGGIELVVSKPYRIDCLLSMFGSIDSPAHNDSAGSPSLMRAA